MTAEKPKSRKWRAGERAGASTASPKSPRTAANKTSRTTSRTASRTNQHRRKSVSGKKSGRWIAGVTTVSTYPPQGLFTKDAATIARTLATKKVSPKGPTSGLRMLLYFINRAGKGLSPQRRAELEKATALLSERIRNRKKTPHRTE
jgi:tRNA(adenine34) deaminase